ncbi:MAG: outer membrane beta-barrel protein [Acidobacteria bacterium]|nr:outer membrane beta-barrel protein [Acidobacteriota bacterium]
MTKLWAGLAVAACVYVMPDAAFAQQRFDVGLMLGQTKTSDEGAALQFDPATAWQATFAWRVWANEAVRVSVEVPFLASPAFEVATPGRTLPKEYASLYLTPGVRVTLPANGPVSAFGSVGAGYARYSESKLRADGSPNPDQRDTNAGALQLDGGVDVRGFGWLGFRGEVRDVLTGARNFSIATPRGRVHNVTASGGLVLRF